MTFTSTDPSSRNSENCWFTPPEIVKSLGVFDVDVCTMSFRPFDIARFHIEHDLGNNSLMMDWFGCVWMNPPYGKENEPFIKKFKEHGNGICLVFARMGTSWMQDWISSGGGVFFLRKRIVFIDRNKKRASGSAGADSCLLFIGDEARKRIENSGLLGVFR